VAAVQVVGREDIEPVGNLKRKKMEAAGFSPLGGGVENGAGQVNLEWSAYQPQSARKGKLPLGSQRPSQKIHSFGSNGRGDDAGSSAGRPELMRDLHNIGNLENLENLQIGNEKRALRPRSFQRYSAYESYLSGKGARSWIPSQEMVVQKETANELQLRNIEDMERLSRAKAVKKLESNAQLLKEEKRKEVQRKEMLRLRSENSTLKTSIQDKEDEMEKKKKELLKLQEQLYIVRKGYDHKRDELEQQISASKRSLQQQESRIRRLEQEREQERARSEALADDLRALQVQKANSDGTCQKLKEELQQKVNATESLRRSLSAEKVRSEEQEASLAKLREDQDRLEKDMYREKQLVQKKEQLLNRRNLEIVTLQEKITELNSQPSGETLVRFREEMKLLDKAVKEYKKKAAEARGKNEALLQENEMLKEELLNGGGSTEILDRKLVELEKGRERAEWGRADVEKEIRKVKDALKDRQSELDRAEVLVVQKEATIQEIHREKEILLESQRELEEKLEESVFKAQECEAELQAADEKFQAERQDERKATAGVLFQVCLHLEAVGQLLSFIEHLLDGEQPPMEVLLDEPDDQDTIGKECLAFTVGFLQERTEILMESRADLSKIRSRLADHYAENLAENCNVQ